MGEMRRYQPFAISLSIDPVIRPSARRCLLEHPLVGADQVPRRLAEDGASAILHSAPEVFVTPCPAPRRIVRRADNVWEVEKRVTHREAAVPHRQTPDDLQIISLTIVRATREKKLKKDKPTPAATT